MSMFIRILNRIEEGIIALLLVGMTLLTFGEVIDRFIFNHGVLWIEELTLHTSAWLVLFGASWALREGAHIGVDAFVKLFSTPIQRVFGFIAAVLAMAYCALLIYGSWVYLAKLIQIGIEMEDLPVPKWIAHSILVTGLLLLMLRLLQLTWHIFTGKETGFRHSDEAQEVLREQGLEPHEKSTLPR